MADQESKLEQLGFGIRRYWLPPHICVIETEGDMSPAAVDLWAEATAEAVLTYPPEQKAIYLLEILSHPNQRLTPYSQQRTRRLYEDIKLTRPVYTAVVPQNTLINQLVSVFVRFLNRSQPLLTQRIFTSKEAAIRWLREQTTHK